MSTASLNGVSCTAMRLQVPAWGAWWADVALSEELDLSGNLEFELAGTALVGSLAFGGSADGVAAARIVGGGGGWGKVIPEKSYNNDLGVKASTVVGDAAGTAGETMGTVDTTIRRGPHYARAEGPASSVLNILHPQNWYVDFDGITHIGRRPTVEYEGDAPRTRVAPASEVIDLAVDSLDGLLPGVVVDGRKPATDVQFTLDNKRLTASIYAAGVLPKRLEAYRRIYDALDPRRMYRGCYDFRVVSQSGEKLNLQPVRVATGLGDLANVPIRPGMAGLRAMVTPGSVVSVSFADADPSRPFVSSHEEQGGPGWMPLLLELGGPGALGAARMTDPVIAGAFSGSIVMGSTRVKISV